MKKPKRITVITPSYNQGKFIEDTIKSVISQKYSDLEFIVMDGGSTDETVSILKKYQKILKNNQHITFIWQSEKDKGQADAINKGLKISSGNILAYLNSDDMYEANALQVISTYFEQHPKVHFVYGKGKLIDLKGNDIGFYNDFQVNYEKLNQSCGISQPTAFWTRKVFEQIGYFDDKFHFTMDYEYWVRVSKKFQMVYLSQFLANTRIHPEAKTASQTQKLYKDAIKVQKKHYSFVHHDWIFTSTDGLVHSWKNSHWYTELFYWIVLFVGSAWLQLYWNHQIPSSFMTRQYMLWLKEIKNRFNERLNSYGK